MKGGTGLKEGDWWSDPKPMQGVFPTVCFGLGRRPPRPARPPQRALLRLLFSVRISGASPFSLLSSAALLCHINYSLKETRSAEAYYPPDRSATNSSLSDWCNKCTDIVLFFVDPDMSTMTELQVKSKPSAALLFESDAVKAESLDLGIVKEEEMLDLSGSTIVKEGSVDTDMSRSASVEAKTEDDSSKSATPSLPAKSKSKPGKAPVQLIGHLPRAEEEAMATFIEIPDNHYQYSTLGKSREALESMTCDCQYEHGQSMFPPVSSRLYSVPLSCPTPSRTARL